MNNDPGVVDLITRQVQPDNVIFITEQCFQFLQPGGCSVCTADDADHIGAHVKIAFTGAHTVHHRLDHCSRAKLVSFRHENRAEA